MTFTHYYNVWVSEMVMFKYHDFKSLMPYSTFIRSWYCYLMLLDVDWETGMLCEECGPSPRLVICDGTQLGFQKKFLPVVLEACPIEKEVISRVRYISSSCEDISCQIGSMRGHQKKSWESITKIRGHNMPNLCAKT